MKDKRETIHFKSAKLKITAYILSEIRSKVIFSLPKGYC